MSEAEEKEQAVIWLIAGEHREAVSLERIERLIRSPQIVAVPGAPEKIAGVLEYQGELITVYNPLRRGTIEHRVRGGSPPGERRI